MFWGAFYGIIVFVSCYLQKYFGATPLVPFGWFSGFFRLMGDFFDLRGYKYDFSFMTPTPRGPSLARHWPLTKYGFQGPLGPLGNHPWEATLSEAPWVPTQMTPGSQKPIRKHQWVSLMSPDRFLVGPQGASLREASQGWVPRALGSHIWLGASDGPGMGPEGLVS